MVNARARKLERHLSFVRRSHSTPQGAGVGPVGWTPWYPPRMTGWIALVLAGLFEVAFTSSLKLSEDFTKGRYVAVFVISVICSFALLASAMKTIPLGTAYAVWTGIGAVGTALIGIVFFRDPSTFWRIFFLTLLIGSIVGLKVVSPEATDSAS